MDVVSRTCPTLHTVLIPFLYLTYLTDLPVAHLGLTHVFPTCRQEEPADLTDLTDLNTDLNTDLHTDLNTDLTTDLNTDLSTDLSTDLNTDLTTDLTTDLSTDLTG